MMKAIDAENSWTLFEPVVGVLFFDPKIEGNSHGQIQIYPLNVDILSSELQKTSLFAVYSMIISKAMKNLDLTDEWKDCDNYLENTDEGSIQDQREFFEALKVCGILGNVKHFNVESVTNLSAEDILKQLKEQI